MYLFTIHYLPVSQAQTYKKLSLSLSGQAVQPPIPQPSTPYFCRFSLPFVIKNTPVHPRFFFIRQKNLPLPVSAFYFYGKERWVS
jgi:hypothetical protein